jgi:UDP-glucose 4-epimerase
MTAFKNKIILVTGGAGFIGSHLVDKALELGAEKVISYDNLVGCNDSTKNHGHLRDARSEGRFEFVKGDMIDSERLNPILDKVDVIFNEAASKLVVSLKNPYIDLQTNTIANFNMLEHLRKSKNNPRIIHASTGSVFGSSEKPFKEEDAKNPSTTYGISKLAGENYHLFYTKEYGLRSTVLRYFHVYGPRQDYSGEAGVVSIFLSKVLKGEAPTVFGSGEQIRCFTYVDDDVNANIVLYKNNSSIGQSYNVASKERISVLELANKIIQKYDKTKKLKPIMGPLRMGENLRPVPDTSKIEGMGWKANFSFNDGLDLTKKWIEKDN